MKFRPGTIVKSWATDLLKEHQTGIVIRVKPEAEDSLPDFVEILWDDGTLSGEFVDELEPVEISKEEK